MNRSSTSRLWSATASLIFAAGVAFAPATARAGFFEDLFSGGTPAPVGPSVPAPGTGASPGYDDFGVPIRNEHRRPKKKIAAAPATPVLQKTTALMDDKTLRPGDAVMMKTGVHVYAGPEDSHHDLSQFVALGAARHVSPKEREQLASMDMTRRNPLEYVADNKTILHQGRSVGDERIVAGYKITDARGRSIRYVGP